MTLSYFARIWKDISEVLSQKERRRYAIMYLEKFCDEYEGITDKSTHDALVLKGSIKHGIDYLEHEFGERYENSRHKATISEIRDGEVIRGYMRRVKEVKGN